MAVGLVGVIVVLRPGRHRLDAGHLPRSAPAVFSAVGAVVVRKIGHEERSAVLLLYPMMANFLVMGLRAALRLPADARAAPRRRRVMACSASSAGSASSPPTASAGAVVVAPMQYSQILWAVVYGYAFFGETPDRAPRSARPSSS